VAADGRKITQNGGDYIGQVKAAIEALVVLTDRRLLVKRPLVFFKSAGIDLTITTNHRCT